MERGKSLTMTVYGGAVIGALMVIISMFFNYTMSTVGAFNKTGFGIFSSESGLNITLLVLSLIISVCIVVMGIIRLMGMLEGKSYSYLFALLGLALLIVSIILISSVVKTTWANQIFEYKRGFGVVLNLIFSIITALFALGSLAVRE